MQLNKLIAFNYLRALRMGITFSIIRQSSSKFNGYFDMIMLMIRKKWQFTENGKYT